MRIGRRTRNDSDRPAACAEFAVPGARRGSTSNGRRIRRGPRPVALISMRIWRLLALPLLFGRLSPGADSLAINSTQIQYTFGSEILFSATVRSGEPVRRAELAARIAGSETGLYPAEVSAREEDYLLAVRWDLARTPVFPFSPLEYWWTVETESGSTTASAPLVWAYEDRRFAWQRMEKGRASVSWVEGDSSQADDVADLVLLSLGTESADLDTPIPQRIRLYIYPRLADLHSGLGKEVRGWEGAVSDPASGVILVAAAPGAGGRRALAALLPHEVSHLLLGMKWKAAYALLPVWLTEGLAGGFEMAPRPELEAMLADAVKSGRLLPFSALCRSFPAEEEAALLAYAESRSFVAFLRSEFGLAAVREAIAAYAAGAPCAGSFASTGRTIDDLEQEWIGRMTEGRSGAYGAAGGLLAAGLGLLACILLIGWLVRRRGARRGGEGTAR
jgi:hypothetical protein